MSNENIALIDLDNTLCDYERALFDDLIKLQSPNEPDIRDSISLHNDKMPIYLKNRINLIKSRPGWWENLPEHKLGFDVLRDLMQLGFNVHVCTKGPWRIASAWTEKLNWCRTHLPSECSVTITEDKKLVYGKVLVDDYPDYMSGWLSKRPRGLGILIDNQTNRDFNHPQVIRYNGTNKAEVYNALKIVKNREKCEPLQLR